jgi:hypothetical protein
MSTPDVPLIRPTHPRFDDAGNPFVIYCNSTEMTVTPWDIRIKLMEMYDAEGTTPIVRKHGVVVTSPMHAKAMLEALKTTIQKYEENFGTIDLERIQAVIKTVTSP